MPRFARHARAPFERWIKPRFAGKPIRYLELGVWQGASAKWMFENILTHPDSKADLVDPWLPYEADAKHVYTQEMMDDALRSVDQMFEQQHKGFRCFIWQSDSISYLYECEDTYDLVYQDGAHDAKTVLMDATALIGHEHKLVNPGGWIVFDDCNEPGVRKAVNVIADIFSDRLAPVYATKQQRCFEVRSQDGQDG